MSDMFEKTEAHKATMNEAAKDRFDKYNALTPELKMRANAIGAEKKARLAELEKDQQNREPDVWKEELQKAAAEKPSPSLDPEWAKKSRTRENIERDARDGVEKRFAEERAEAARPFDERFERLVKQSERPDYEGLPPASTPQEEQARDFGQTGSEMTMGSDWTDEQAALYQQLQARFDAEKGHNLDGRGP